MSAEDSPLFPAFADEEGNPVRFELIDSYSVSIGWNDDGTLRVVENGEEVYGADAARVVGAFGGAVGWRILELALDPDGSKRAEFAANEDPSRGRDA